MRDRRADFVFVLPRCAGFVDAFAHSPVIDHRGNELVIRGRIHAPGAPVTSHDETGAPPPHTTIVAGSPDAESRRRQKSVGGNRSSFRPHAVLRPERGSVHSHAPFQKPAAGLGRTRQEQARCGQRDSAPTPVRDKPDAGSGSTSTDTCARVGMPARPLAIVVGRERLVRDDGDGCRRSARGRRARHGDRLSRRRRRSRSPVAPARRRANPSRDRAARAPTAR